MKKIIVILLAMLGLSASAQIQDTIYNRIPHCWYPSWYDECYDFLVMRDTTGGHQGWNFDLTGYGTNTPRSVAKSYFTDEPIAVNGIAVLVEHTNAPGGSWGGMTTPHNPEFAMVYQGDGRDDNGYFNLKLLDSVRWDTLPPSILKLPMMADTALFGFAYCEVYQVHFDSPVIVDSTFYLGGTQWSNHNFFPYQLGYAYIHGTWDSAYCTNDEILILNRIAEQYRWFTMSNWPSYLTYYGMFIPMVDFAMLNVEQDGDSLMGSVSPSGSHSIHTDQVIQAMPGPGYAFSHWNDGDTSNPRVIHLMQDTLFTAYFIVDTVSRDTSGADTTGADTTGTTAIRLPAAQAPAFTLAPNPADGAVTVTVEGAGLAAATITVTDLAGKQMLHQAVAGPQFTIPAAQLAPGIYFVTLATPQGTSTQKLVVTD